MQSQTFITEIFSSLQGEGPRTFEPTTFVRFSGCSLGCAYCDTKYALLCNNFCRIENPPRSKSFINVANPLSIEELAKQLRYFEDPVISITGGEPLEHADYIKKWLDKCHPGKQILLETNGTLADELLKVGRFVDIFSVDIKLPSSSGTAPLWDAHKAFLSNAVSFGKEVYVKMIVTKQTSTADIQEAIKIIAGVNKFIQVVLQPVGATDSFSQKASEEKLLSLQRLCSMWLPNVCIMKQMHKEAGIL